MAVFEALRTGAAVNRGGHVIRFKAGQVVTPQDDAEAARMRGDRAHWREVAEKVPAAKAPAKKTTPADKTGGEE